MAYQITSSSLMFVYRTWARRSRFTSIERFAGLFPNVRHISNQNIPRLPSRLLRLLARSAEQSSYSSWSAGLELTALRDLLRYRPRVVHFLYADHDYHYFAKFARHLGTKTVGTFWFSIEEFERRMPRKAHLRKLDLVIASGRKQLDYLQSYVDEEHLAYLPLGVDTDFFIPPMDPTFRWQTPHHILQVGINRRDFAVAKQAFSQLRRLMPTLELHMVGCGEAQPFFEGMEGVVFHPMLTDEHLVAIYQRSLVLLLPLLEGGSSNALNEAFATGLPVVATHMPNLEDYVSAECVILCPPGNPDAMADACLTLLKDYDYWRTVSHAARKQSEKFNWRNIKEQLLSIYSSRLGFSFPQSDQGEMV